MRALPTAAILLAACSGGRGAARAEPPAIRWEPATEIAAGGGHRGEWRQNDSDYDYVDDPSVAFDAEGDAAVVWVDQAKTEVFFQRYARDGTPRLPRPVDVSRTPGVFSWLPRIAVVGDDVYVLWQEIVFSGGSHGGEAFFARSRDRGATFEPPLNLSQSPSGDGKGRITKDVWHNGSLDLGVGPDGTIYAAWTEYDGPLWFSRSRDRGGSFGRPVRVDGGGKPARAPALAIAADGTVYLAWTVGEDDGADLRLATSSDRGETFAAPAIVARTPGYSDAPKLAVDRAGTLHVVHAESDGGPFDRYAVRYTRSRDRGRTFETARELSHPAGTQSAAFPMLALDGTSVAVVWEHYARPRALPRGLAIAYSLDGGTTFSAPALVDGSVDPAGGWNGSHQGRLMRKLAVRDGRLAIVNSALAYGRSSRVWLVRGELPGSIATR
jgi:hypothetical protein